MELQHYILQCSSFSEIRNQSSFAPGAGALYGEEKHSHHGHLSTCTEQGAKLDHFVSPHTNGSVNPERYLHSREGVNQAVREIKGERHECSLRKVLWFISPCLAQIEARLGSTQATLAVSSCIIQGCHASPRVCVQSQTIRYGRKKDGRRKHSWRVPGKQPKTWTIGMPQGVPLPW